MTLGLQKPNWKLRLSLSQLKSPDRCFKIYQTQLLPLKPKVRSHQYLGKSWPARLRPSLKTLICLTPLEQNLHLMNRKSRNRNVGALPTMILHPLRAHWWWLPSSPVGHHELLELELLWAWDQTVSLRAFRNCESKRSQPNFLDGDKEESGIS